MAPYKKSPITSENLNQAVKELTKLRVWSSASKIADFISSMLTFFLALFIILNLVIGICVPPEELSDLDPYPALRAIAAFSIESMNQLPEAWYIRLAVCLPVLVIPSFLFYQLVYPLLFLPLSKRSGRLSLPSKTIPKAKKLYHTAKKMSDQFASTALPAAYTTTALVFFALLAFLLYELLVAGTIDMDELIVFIPGTAVLTFLVFVVYGWFYGLCYRVSTKPFNKKHNEYFSQTWKLKSNLHLYWQSVDPEEAERVEAEERERRRLADLRPTLPKPDPFDLYYHPLTNEDHDALDAVQRAARLEGRDYHTGV